MPPFVVKEVDAAGNVTGSNSLITVSSTPSGPSASLYAVNGIAVFSGIVFNSPGIYTITASSAGLASATSNPFFITVSSAIKTSVGILRGGVFNFDSNGNNFGPAPNDPADRVDTFAPPGGILPGDVAVVGDWTGDGHFKAGWFRAAGGKWFLDANNNGVFDAGDLSYTGFGGLGDFPVIGDWAGLGKSAIGVVSGGFLWILDLNADGVFQSPVCTPMPPTPTYPNCGADTISGDAVFAFGGAPGDVPVVGNWYGKSSAGGFPISQAGMVRPYSPFGAPVTAPFLWLLDIAVPGTANNVTPQSAHAIGNLPGIAFGGFPGDMPMTGDWFNGGVTQFGVFRQGFLWMLDGALPVAPQAAHVAGLVFPYGGLAIDKPIAGKW
jgi:hypothetical protein